MKYAIEHVFELRLSKPELEKLTLRERCFFGLLCYILTELNVLGRTYLEAGHERTGDTSIDAGLITQRHVLLRCFTSRTYEALKFLMSLHSGEDESEVFDAIVFDAISKAKALREQPGYSLNERLRDEAINHYDLKAAEKSWSHLDEGTMGTLYLTEKDGNSYYPLGDSLIFLARLKRLSQSRKEWVNSEQIIDDWLDWTLDVKRLISNIHFETFEKIVIAKVGDKNGRKRSCFIPTELVSGDRPSMPLFYRGQVR